MTPKHYAPAEIVKMLRQVETLVSEGTSEVEAIQTIGITMETFYRWRHEYGGLRLWDDQTRGDQRLREAEAENARLRQVERSYENLRDETAHLRQTLRSQTNPGWTRLIHPITWKQAWLISLIVSIALTLMTERYIASLLFSYRERVCGIKPDPMVMDFYKRLEIEVGNIGSKRAYMNTPASVWTEFARARACREMSKGETFEKWLLPPGYEGY